MSDALFPTPNCIGWLLAEARVALAANARTQDCLVRIIETAPPPRPPRWERPAGAGHKAHKPENRPPETHYGEWRVLRCGLVENGTVSAIELVVAREQIL